MKYKHGGNAFEYGKGILDFSANINPLGTPQAVKDAVMAALDKTAQYPDYKCARLREKIAEREDVPSEYIICGNGAAELIYSLVYAVKPKRAVVHKPAFAEYADAVRAADGIISEADGELEFICNPNNPTGALTETTEIIQRLETADRLIVVDECFNDFLDEPEQYSCVSLLSEYKRLVILKSFTKMYAMPGIRLGYLMTSDTELIERIYKARQPWSVSVLAQAAGLAACRDRETPVKTREYIRKEKEYFERELERLGIEYIKPSANFIFFKSIPGLQARLLEKNILIRDCSDYDGLNEGSYRIGIKKHEDNKRLIKALEEAIEWQGR
ncbi:MAG: pyridoxal phosphate-dependent aminotransferase [Candidatus Ornithomonoglobus sp.]